MVKVSHSVWRTAPLGLLMLAFACSPSRAADLTPRDNSEASGKGNKVQSGNVTTIETKAKRTDAKTKAVARGSGDQDKLEREVLDMVDAHLPDIKVLLDQLRDKEPRQYDVAIRNLARSSRRLQAAQKRGAEAFEIEVQIVKSQSAINLLIAKLKVRDNEKDRQALLKAAKQLELAEIERASQELEQLKARLEKAKQLYTAAEKRLHEKQSQSDKTIDRLFQNYLRKSGRK